MIVNILKLVFIYFIYRFFKLMLKGYLKNKIIEAQKKVFENHQTGAGPFGYHQSEDQKSNARNHQNGSKTFEAEYKIIND